ncbi:MAG: glutamyl-tRNA reductase [Thermoanaerobaculum sp.]|nr:glutamyl-tRNA reductase [Thermoanaerobaculum sp.]MDW7968337.1 glutamyl-tRNA reductase [Thermoanaerobaculum sp.]
METLFALGTNHRLATLEEVTRARIPEALLPQALHRIAERLRGRELVYLATCHRTEFYLVHDGGLCPGRLTQALRTSLAELTDGRGTLPEPSRCLMLQAADAAQHLFRVSAALDSLMLGESQILGQVKEAYRQSVQAGLVGPRLHTVFAQAFRAAKRVRSETKLSQGPTSLVSLAARVLRQRFAEDPRPVAILGAGTMAEAAAGLVRKLAPQRPVWLFNRSRERGHALAQRVGAQFADLAAFPPAEGPLFSVIILALAVNAPFIREDLAAKLSPVLLLDLGLPANVSARCAHLPGVELVDQVSLREESEANRQARSAEVAKAEAIVAQQLAELSLELLDHQLSPIARTLREAFFHSARWELRQAFSNGHGTLPAEFLDQLADRLAQKLVRTPLRGLRQVAFAHSPKTLQTFLEALDREYS